MKARIEMNLSKAVLFFGLLMASLVSGYLKDNTSLHSATSNSSYHATIVQR